MVLKMSNDVLGENVLSCLTKLRQERARVRPYGWRKLTNLWGTT